MALDLDLPVRYSIHLHFAFRKCGWLAGDDSLEHFARNAISLVLPIYYTRNDGY